MQEMVALKQRLDSANINQVYNKDALKTAFTSLEAYPNDINEITQELDDMWTTLSASLDQLQTTNRNLLTIVERLSRDLKDTRDNI
jgi:tRNA U34 5-methylaminomethyl-2-thiouridine-forming methyltransferase MnmC